MVFEYHPLEARDFRILLLSPGERFDSLKATLKPVSLDDDTMPEYETTSYASSLAEKRVSRRQFSSTETARYPSKLSGSALSSPEVRFHSDHLD